MSRSVRLGLFMLTTLAIFAAGVFLVGRQESKFGSNYQVRSEFANVAGLSEGADVRVGGIRKGTVRSIRLLVLRLARENPALGLPPHPRRTARPGFRTAASNVWEILRQAGIDARFLRSQADALLACDFFETVTLSGVRLYVLVTWNQAGELRGLDHQSSGD